MAIRIVTDSVADLAPALASANDITVVAAYVIIGGETYADGVEITADDFYARLPGLSSLPTTSQPTIGDFQSVYQQLLDDGHQVVSVHVSSKLSGTVNSAMQAKAALGDNAPIEIVDSQLASIPQGLAVINAAQWAREMSDYQEVARRTRESLSQIHAYVLVDTLEYLQKGGRIGKAAAFLGGMLKVKPILTIRDGEVHPVERPRSTERARNRLAELVRELAPVRQINLCYSTNQAHAIALQSELSSLVSADNLIESRFGPTLGTYLGPDALGVAVTQGN